MLDKETPEREELCGLTRWRNASVSVADSRISAAILVIVAVVATVLIVMVVAVSSSGSRSSSR